MVCNIDCSGINDAKELHRVLARYLEFPQWYGHNLDALYDCLTELPQDTRLYFSSWGRIAHWASGFEAVLCDAELDCPELIVFFERS